MKTILITGGTGLIGQRLSQKLKEKGYQVRHLSRRANPNATFPAYQWDLSKNHVDPKAFEGVDSIVHLAGAGVVDKRWTTARKKEIEASRVNGIKLLYQYLSQKEHTVKSFVGASAIGFYGDTADRINTTETEAGKDFLSEICVRWEKASLAMEQLDLRTSLIRIGIVLSTKGGALEKMLPSYKVRIGAYFGDGEQYYSWIHINDLCKIFVEAIENENMQGIYNGVAPEAVSNKHLAKTIAKAMDKKALVMPVPAFALRLAMGEMAVAILDSTRVQPNRLLENKFVFDHPDLEQALRDLLEKGL
ncbi:MAG: TIGR01777 family oxidoreductase [Saprospiraceae bacterium]|nr:TIGR01777 family oxidoreductase [Saprospiraceae bacterium]